MYSAESINLNDWKIMTTAFKIIELEGTPNTVSVLRKKQLLANNPKFSVVPAISKEQPRCEGTLLFLASDVLTGTSILKKNFIRVHGRFSKLGVASKMSLKGFKIDGINNSGVIWFYNIKGLFRVAFELGSEPFQKDCLTLLQSEWLKRFDEPHLLQDQTIHLPPVEISDCSFQGQSSSENARETVTVYVYDENTVVKIENEENDSAKDEQEALDMQSKDKLVNMQSCNNTANVNESFTVNESINTEKQTDVLIERENMKGDFLIDRNQDTCNDGNEGDMNEVNTQDESQSKEVYDEFESETEMWKSLTAEVFLQKLDVFLKDCVCMSSDGSLQCVTSNLLVTVTLLQNLLSTSQGQLLEDGLMIFQLINKYSYLVSTDQEDKSTIDTFGISRLKFLLLYVLSERLGKEFNNLETTISQKVELFKKQNIQNIANLPSAEQTIDLLFPTFMKVLISSWLGENHEACSSDIDLSEHDYCSSEQRTKVDLQRYLLVQLILEFVTNSLISGPMFLWGRFLNYPCKDIVYEMHNHKEYMRNIGGGTWYGWDGELLAYFYYHRERLWYLYTPVVLLICLFVIRKIRTSVMKHKKHGDEKNVYKNGSHPHL